MKAIIFGVNGQDGFYLSSLLQHEHINMIGVSRSNPLFTIGDVADRDFVDALVKQEMPDYIFNLAANSSTRHDLLFENHTTIATGSLNILEAVYRYSPHTRVFLSGSGLQFRNEGLPISETHPFEARDPYSIARIQSAYAARYYRTLGLQVYLGYFFHHDSPLRTERHVNQKIVQAVKQISQGRKTSLDLGDLSVQKEFGFAGDIVAAIWRLVNQEQVYEAVIGTGIAYPIEEWVRICFGWAGLDWKSYITKNDEVEKQYDILVSDPTTIFGLGWQPETTITSLAEMMLKTNQGDRGT